MAAVTICSDFGAPQNKVSHCFHCFPIYAMNWWDWMPWSEFFECWVLSQLFYSPLPLSSRKEWTVASGIFHSPLSFSSRWLLVNPMTQLVHGRFQLGQWELPHLIEEDCSDVKDHPEQPALYGKVRSRSNVWSLSMEWGQGKIVSWGKKSYLFCGLSIDIHTVYKQQEYNFGIKISW